MKNRLIRLFEHDTLKIGDAENELKYNEYDSLCRFYEEVDNRYFTLERRKIKFKHYVGVLQLGSLTIEVLPKVGRDQDDADKWHDALVKMLKYTQKIRSYATSDSSLDYSRQSLLDLYFDQYMHEVEVLLKEGLRKRYRVTEGNLSKIKGRILFNKNINKNIVHKDKTYCSYQTFDFDHDLHKTLKFALLIAKDVVRNNSLKAKAKKFLLSFPEEVGSHINIVKLDRIRLDRTTKRYERALELAKLIIKSYCPVFTQGRMSVLAFMFDMNHLFEEFIFKVLKRQLDDANVNKRMKYFWENKMIKPDIFIQTSKAKIVIDTKWKIPRDGIPSDNDLKQVYVYNHYFDSVNSFLLYPFLSNKTIGDEGVDGEYTKKMYLNGDEVSHFCGVKHIQFFNENNIFDVEFISNNLKQLIIGL